MSLRYTIGIQSRLLALHDWLVQVASTWESRAESNLALSLTTSSILWRCMQAQNTQATPTIPLVLLHCIVLYRIPAVDVHSHSAPWPRRMECRCKVHPPRPYANAIPLSEVHRSSSPARRGWLCPVLLFSVHFVLALPYR